MADEPFYSPAWKAPAPKSRTPGEPLWELRKDHVTWSCELRFHGESYGWDMLILKDGELFYSQRFILREAAQRRAEEQRQLVERGWLDAD